MKIYLILLIFLLSISVNADDNKTLRLLTYNIHAGIGIDRKFDLERIAAVIKQTNPHVVALQEVDKVTKRSKGVDIATRLAELTEMKSLFGPAISFGGGEYGNAILTNLEIKQSDNTPIPRKIETEQRSLLTAELIFQNETVHILATHLCHKENENRVHAAKFIATRASENTSFLMGDLNALPKSQPMKILAEAGWHDPSTEPAFTVPVDNPTRQIDFILFKPAKDKPLKVREVRVIDEKVASDHRPLLVVFEW